VPALAISSSYLRGRVAAGQSLRYLTPGSVYGYIYKHHLYGSEPAYGRFATKGDDRGNA
jgi:nicotinate-nucleotide adenylyltransferase